MYCKKKKKKININYNSTFIYKSVYFILLNYYNLPFYVFINYYYSKVVQYKLLWGVIWGQFWKIWVGTQLLIWVSIEILNVSQSEKLVNFDKNLWNFGPLFEKDLGLAFLCLENFWKCQILFKAKLRQNFLKIEILTISTGGYTWKFSDF